MLQNIKEKVKKKIKRMISTRKYQKYHRSSQKKKQIETIIFNAPNHGNIGDHAILYAEEQLFEKYHRKLFEISTFEEEYYFPIIERKLPKNAEIYITGGGFIGSQWLEEQHLVCKVIERFKDYKITIFPQTFYFKEDEIGKKELETSKAIFNKARKLTICAREEKTYEFIQKNYPNAKCVLLPDMVLSLPKKITNHPRKGILLCLREDPEGILKQNQKESILEKAKQITDSIKVTDTVISEVIRQKDRKRKVIKKLDEFSQAKLVITDRLHGMIFAYLTNTPCIVMGNYNHKVEGVYQWIKETDYILFEKEIDSLKEDIKQQYEKTYTFPTVELIEKFKPIADDERK